MAKKFNSYKEESRKNWGAELEEGVKLDNRQLMLGATLRIADATELMAKNFLQLQSDRDMYKRWYQNAEAESKQLRKQVASYKGVITKLKKKRI